MNNHQKSCYRDRQIQQALSEWGCLDIVQVAQMFFPSLSTAQRRMQRLSERGKVNRCREDLGQPYRYYIDKKPVQIEHRLGVNWIRLWLLSRMKSWEQVYYFGYEINYGPLRPDGLTGIKNTLTGKYHFTFIEYDRGFNKFDKAEKYEKWFDSDGYAGQWWAEKADRFPSVLVVSERPPKVKSKLDFKIIPYEEVLKCRTVSLSGNLLNPALQPVCVSE